MRPRIVEDVPEYVACGPVATASEGGHHVPMSNLDDVLAAEMRLLDPAVRASRPQLEELLGEDFREFGSSGREWQREAIIDALVSEPAAPPPAVDQVRFQELGPDVVLLTYRSASGRYETLRSSIWCRVRDRWILRFHQGTPAEER